MQAAHRQASEHLEKLKAEHEADPGGENRRQQAAQQRAARERKERIEQAQKELQKLQQSRQKLKRESDSCRVSTTDPEARRTKMGHGGFQPALNVQFVTDADTRLIVGVDVTSTPSDSGQMDPMRCRVSENYGTVPSSYRQLKHFFVQACYRQTKHLLTPSVPPNETPFTVKRNTFCGCK